MTNYIVTTSHAAINKPDGSVAYHYRGDVIEYRITARVIEHLLTLGMIAPIVEPEIGNPATEATA